MFILKASNVRSGWLLPTKEANDFHASFFSTLIPLPRLQGLCCHCRQTGIKSLPEGAVHLGNVQETQGGPNCASLTPVRSQEASGPQGRGQQLASAHGRNGVAWRALVGQGICDDSPGQVPPVPLHPTAS